MATLQNTTVNGTLAATTFSGPGSDINGFNTSVITSQLPQSVATSGVVINRTDYNNATRIALSSSSNLEIYSFTITKLQSGSSLWIKGVIPMSGEDATVTTSGIGFYIAVDGVKNYTGIASDNLDSQGCGVTVSQLRTGISAGTRTISLGWTTADGQAIRYASAVNQNGISTDARNRQNGTFITVWELK
jgi:hypothetical protein